MNTTRTQVAGALGAELSGQMDAFAASSGNALHAFIVSVPVIGLLSVALSLTALPLAGPRPVTTNKGASVPPQERAQENGERTETIQTIHAIEKGIDLSCPGA